MRPASSPFVVLVDTREQLPYSFAGLRADSHEGGGPLEVRSTRSALLSGDYSIQGYARMVAVERKTQADLFATLTQGRKRFLKELERLREYDRAWVVCECQLSDILAGLGENSRVRPRTIIRSAMYWQLRYPTIHWWACPGRAVAEAVTYQLLRAWWRERIEKPDRAALKARRAGN